MLCSGSGSWLTWGTARPDGTSCASRPGIAYKSSTEEEMDGTASVVLSVEDPQELLIELFMQEKKVLKLIFWPLIILEEYQVTNLLVDEEGLVVSVLGEEEDH